MRKMRQQARFGGILVALVLAACTVPPSVDDTIEGQFKPACLALAGDIIDIEGDRYTWRKFTDEIVVGDDGELIEPFPGFPKSGQFTREGDELRLLNGNGEPSAAFYVRKRADGVYLLTADESASDTVDAAFWRCALKLTRP
ncbi:MAG: hypothetical protein AAAFM81_00225 [Pseudomonadota bacterium]